MTLTTFEPEKLTTQISWDSEDRWISVGYYGPDFHDQIINRAACLILWFMQGTEHA